MSAAIVGLNSTKTSLNAIEDVDISDVSTPVQNIVKGKNSSGKKGSKSFRGRKNKR